MDFFGEYSRTDSMRKMRDYQSLNSCTFKWEKSHDRIYRNETKISDTFAKKPNYRDKSQWRASDMQCSYCI